MATPVSCELYLLAKILANLIFFSPMDITISQWRNGERPGRALHHVFYECYAADKPR